MIDVNLKGSFLVPLAATLKQAGLKLDVIAANAHAAATGVAEGQSFMQALSVLTQHVDRAGKRRGAALPLRACSRR